MKILQWKKFWLIGILALVVPAAMGIYLNSATQKTDYQKQYSQEEWDALSKAEQEELRKWRLCKNAKDVVFVDIDCSKYQ